jgi:hypothetical protein
LDDSQQFIEPCLHNAKLRREGVGFVGQDLQIAGDSTVVAHVGTTRRVLDGSEAQFLLCAEFAGLAVSHQGIRDVSKSSLNRWLVKQNRRLLARLRETHLRSQPPHKELPRAVKSAVKQLAAAAPAWTHPVLRQITA